MSLCLYIDVVEMYIKFFGICALFVNFAFARDINLLMPQKYEDIKEFAILSDYKAHMWNIRKTNKNPMFQFVRNQKYEDTVYHIIPSEILTACFEEGIYKKSGIITLDHIGKDIKNYSVAELNYLLLVNTINLYKHKQVKVDAIQEAKDLIADYFKDKIDSSKLSKSVSDIKFYFDNMQLKDYLSSVLNVNEYIDNQISIKDKNGIDGRTSTTLKYKYTEIGHIEVITKTKGNETNEKHDYSVLIRYTNDDRFVIQSGLKSTSEDAKQDILVKINTLGVDYYHRKYPRGIINFKGKKYNPNNTINIDISYYSSLMMFLYNSEKFRNLIYELSMKKDGLARIIRDVFNLMNSNVTLFPDDKLNQIHMNLYVNMLNYIDKTIPTTLYSVNKTKKSRTIVQFPPYLLIDIYQVLSIECDKFGDEELKNMIKTLHAPIKIECNDITQSKTVSMPMVIPKSKLYDSNADKYNNVTDTIFNIKDIVPYTSAKGYENGINNSQISKATPLLNNDEIIVALDDHFRQAKNKIAYSYDDGMWNRYDATGVIRWKPNNSYSYINIKDKLEFDCEDISQYLYDNEPDHRDILIRFCRK